MTDAASHSPDRAVPRIERLRVRNYRVLRDVTLSDLTPLTVLIGPNGSGKSTVLDVLSFLAECVTEGLRPAWERRGRFRDMRSREAHKPIIIEIAYRSSIKNERLFYRLEIDEKGNRPLVKRELFGPSGSFKIDEEKDEISQLIGDLVSLYVEDGVGFADLNGKAMFQHDPKKIPLSSDEMLGLDAFGRLSPTSQVSRLRHFLANWRISNIDFDKTRELANDGPTEHLSSSGNNLANVLQYLREKHPATLDRVFSALRMHVPQAEWVEPTVLADDRLLLFLKDAAFDQPFPARFVSDGTLKLLAYLVLLYDPMPLNIIGIEEPENLLHPKLLYELAEECAVATASTQIFVSTHSPYFLGPLQPESVWVMYRGEDGFARAERSSDIRGVREFMEEGARLGELWMEGYLEGGRPRPE